MFVVKTCVFQLSLESLSSLSTRYGCHVCDLLVSIVFWTLSRFQPANHECESKFPKLVCIPSTVATHQNLKLNCKQNHDDNPFTRADHYGSPCVRSCSFDWPCLLWPHQVRPVLGCLCSLTSSLPLLFLHLVGQGVLTLHFRRSYLCTSLDCYLTSA